MYVTWPNGQTSLVKQTSNVRSTMLDRKQESNLFLLLQDPNRLYYEPAELKIFDNIESEWPVSFIYLLLDGLYNDIPGQVRTVFYSSHLLNSVDRSFWTYCMGLTLHNQQKQLQKLYSCLLRATLLPNQISSNLNCQIDLGREQTRPIPGSNIGSGVSRRGLFTMGTRSFSELSEGNYASCNNSKKLC